VQNPELTRFYAARMHARTIEFPTIRIPFLTHPGGEGQHTEAAAQAIAK
jgi:hypothetical protein